MGAEISTNYIKYKKIRAELTKMRIENDIQYMIRHREEGRAHSELTNLESSVVMNNIPLARHLIENDHEITEKALHISVGLGYYEMTEFLLENHAPYTQDTRGFTPLKIAIITGNREMVELLLRTTAAFDYDGSEDKKGNTPMHYAVYCNQNAICQILFQHGASLNRRNDDGKTPLAFINKENVLLREFLIGNGAV